MLIRLDLQNTNCIPKLGEGSQPWLASPKGQGLASGCCHITTAPAPQLWGRSPCFMLRLKSCLVSQGLPAPFRHPQTRGSCNPPTPFQGRQLSACSEVGAAAASLWDSSSWWLPHCLKDGKMLLFSEKWLHSLLYVTSLWSNWSLHSKQEE